MRITAYGHAALRVDTADGAALLMDPWFSRRGAFFSSWFQFPENHPLSGAAFEGVDHVAVSHNHQDHWDPETLLEALARNPTLSIHIARFTTPWFANRARRDLGDHASNLIEHDPWEPFRIGALEVFFVPEESPAQIDSAIFVRAPGAAMVNLNDARLTTDQLRRAREVIGKPTHVMLQASGASEYPICYTYDAASMLERSLEKRRLKFEHAERILRQLDPDRILFFAGPPVFIDETLAKFNVRSDESVFPDQLDVLRTMSERAPDLAARTYFVLPGEVLSDHLLFTATDLSETRCEPYTKKNEYVAAYAARRQEFRRYEIGECPPDAALLAHFNRMATLSPYVAAMIGGDLVFVIRGRSSSKTITVDFRSGKARFGESAGALYVLEAPAASVRAVLDDAATWDDVMLSARMVFDERTDRFVAHFKTLLKYLDRTLLDRVEDYESGLARGAAVDAMLVRLPDGVWKVQRKCPHSGADLAVHGRTDAAMGTVTCMAHRFAFDIRTGACLNAAGYRLASEKQE